MTTCRRRRLAIAVAVSFAAVAAVGACGAEGEGRAAASFVVIGTEMAFDAPAEVPAAAYKVTFRNEGTVAHELAFRDPAGAFLARRSIASGQSVVMSVTLAPGVYELGCFEPGHYQAGMRAQLTVVAAPGA